MVQDTPEELAVATAGASVRAIRRRLGLSVQALAERAGVSLGLVSQLERGMGNPSLLSLHRVAGALGVPVTALLEEPSPELGVVPADRRHSLPPTPGVAAELQAVRELLTPRGESTIQLIRSTLPPGFSNAERPFRHIGTECVTVVSGRLEVVHGDQRIELTEGDTATYGCSVPHWWANAASTPTVVLGAVTPFER